MFIEQIAGKIITRENFESGGKLTDKQVFTAEKMEHRLLTKENNEWKVTEKIIIKVFLLAV